MGLIVERGEGPVILGLPHVGTELPPEVWNALNARGRILSDTDWHVHELYAGLLPGATMVQATTHRYALDVNRPPDDESLYPGQNTTGLVPMTDFDGADIWMVRPDAAEVARRIPRHHAPYHKALAAEIARVKAIHGVAILYDCHSIRSKIPFLFEGTLPDFNIGDAEGTTCAPEISAAVLEVCSGAPGYSTIHNGRFKGGWTTRHYGRPQEGVHAIQMELAQSTHLATEAPPFALDAAKAARLRPILAEILARLADLAPQLAQR
ncbi:N-formylglutamate deformylase [Neomegalonema sp.]|uniref:N-formylglutamate deformylase n=1 Tax=Neomegalonema sp. TaxID=2039713 RepID=UPI002609EF74|nr:N-formylglutamate deformylase [Neomegalonema sp.]MDD2868470.1 N-formylglutamate deformylase [Neomegalonema sp.]